MRHASGWQGWQQASKQASQAWGRRQVMDGCRRGAHAPGRPAAATQIHISLLQIPPPVEETQAVVAQGSAAQTVGTSWPEHYPCIHTRPATTHRQLCPNSPRPQARLPARALALEPAGLSPQASLLRNPRPVYRNGPSPVHATLRTHTASQARDKELLQDAPRIKAPPCIDRPGDTRAIRSSSLPVFTTRPAPASKPALFPTTQRKWATTAAESRAPAPRWAPRAPTMATPTAATTAPNSSLATASTRPAAVAAADPTSPSSASTPTPTETPPSLLGERREPSERRGNGRRSAYCGSRSVSGACVRRVSTEDIW